MDSIRFLHQRPSGKSEGGIPLVAADERVEDLKEGRPYAVARGVETKLPDQAYDTYCHAEARGALFVARKGGLENIRRAFSDPRQYPKFMSGIKMSRNIRVYPPRESGEIFHWINLQETKSLRYVTRMVGCRYAHGLTFTQISLSEGSAAVYLNRYPKNLESDNLRNFVGQFQILEIANGTLILGEMMADFAKPPIIGCQTAADSDNALFLPDFLGANEAVKQRLEQRLSNIAKEAFPKNPASVVEGVMK